MVSPGLTMSNFTPTKLHFSMLQNETFTDSGRLRTSVTTTKSSRISLSSSGNLIVGPPLGTGRTCTREGSDGCDGGGSARCALVQFARNVRQTAIPNAIVNLNGMCRRCKSALLPELLRMINDAIKAIALKIEMTGF